MPKIIPDIRNRILNSARNQLIESGFDGLSLRRVASDCNIAVGTTYNYFTSKTELAKAVMDRDWKNAMEKAAKERETVDSPAQAVCAIYRQTRAFIKDYGSLLELEKVTAFFGTVSERQQNLVSEIKSLLKETVDYYGYPHSESLLEMEAAMVLAASSAENSQEADFLQVSHTYFSGIPVVRNQQ